MKKGWLLWKYLLKRAARSYDIIDPFAFLARLQRFSEPSEVQEPIELLRAGIIFHARGLINTRAIQHNLDWVWPYWVERQFDPQDVSFIPRGFSFSHVNLTHRNWTAVGLPNLPLYPIVDPRGLVTPCHDGWSIDFWIVDHQGNSLLPSRLKGAEQRWTGEENSGLRTVCDKGTMHLSSVISLRADSSSGVWLQMRVRGRSAADGWLVIALRPYNPEGVQFIEKILYDPDTLCFTVNDDTVLSLAGRPARLCFSNYRAGDVLHRLLDEESQQISVTCDTGMATGAALFPMSAGTITEITCSVNLEEELRKSPEPVAAISKNWSDELRGTAVLRLPDKRLQQLYETAVRTLVQLSAAGPVPGPYTYKRFWFRDACFQLNALLALGMEERCLQLLNRFPERQQRSGYFQSQSGEWDANGQVLWFANRFQEVTGRELDKLLQESIFRGSAWLKDKRATTNGSHAGLLPAGFSAEHFGPNDYYYWDDFWGVAGLRGAAMLAARYRPEEEDRLQAEADDFWKTVVRSIEECDRDRSGGGIPASPHRRLDTGAVGSLVADYPLQLFAPDHPRIRKTVEFLLACCMQHGGFFQDIIHSGVNAYLTLAMAQTLLRCSDDRYRNLIRAVADLASPTGQWPEAIHPLTTGGCMGDGQHGWASAEWIMMIRNLFVREEKDTLIIGSGIFSDWLDEEGACLYGPTPTPYGPVRVEIVRTGERILLRLHAQWRGAPPELTVRVPGYRARRTAPDREEYILENDRV